MLSWARLTSAFHVKVLNNTACYYKWMAGECHSPSMKCVLSYHNTNLLELKNLGNDGACTRSYQYPIMQFHSARQCKTQCGWKGNLLVQKGWPSTQVNESASSFSSPKEQCPYLELALYSGTWPHFLAIGFQCASHHGGSSHHLILFLILLCSVCMCTLVSSLYSALKVKAIWFHIIKKITADLYQWIILHIRVNSPRERLNSGPVTSILQFFILGRDLKLSWLFHCEFCH